MGPKHPCGDIVRIRRYDGEHGTFEATVRRGGTVALKQAENFFKMRDALHQALRRIASRLSDLGIPCAVGGGMTLSPARAQQAT